MRPSHLPLLLTVPAVLLTACAGQSGSASNGQQPPPLVATSTPAGPAATSPTSGATSAPLTTTAPSAATTAPPASRSAATTAPASHPSPTAVRTTKAAGPCAGVTGSTRTINEETGDKFTPANVTINRCDSVKAVYADTTGTPHTFTSATGKWDSGQMSASSKKSFAYTFTSTGTFNFYCSYHRSLGMTGSVTVR